MNFALNNQQKLICYKTQSANQAYFIIFDNTGRCINCRDLLSSTSFNLSVHSVKIEHWKNGPQSHLIIIPLYHLPHTKLINSLKTNDYVKLNYYYWIAMLETITMFANE